MGSLKMEEQKIVELIESVERLGSWAGEKLVELSNRPIVVTGVSVAVASLVSWKLAKCCLAEDKLEDGRFEEQLEEQLEEITPKQSAATEQKVKEETLSPEDKWNKHTEEFCKKQSIPSVQSYYNPRMEESYAERGLQTQRDTIDRSTRPSTTKTQSITTKKSSNQEDTSTTVTSENVDNVDNVTIKIIVTNETGIIFEEINSKNHSKKIYQKTLRSRLCILINVFI